MVEKHICLDRGAAKYDHHSALEPSEMQELADRLVACVLSFSGPFLSESEREYLEKSIQVPVAAKTLLPEGSLLASTDIVFRRTDQIGDTFHQLIEQQKRHSLLADRIEEGSTIRVSQLRPAKIGVIVACRLKSSRLSTKALLPIAGRASVEWCLEECLKFPHAELVVLATSTVEEDAVLESYTLGGKVEFWKGDPDDVIQRYIGACDRFGIDVIYRVTADGPVVSPEIAEFILEKHFQSGADYSAAAKSSPGTAAEVYNTEALRRVISLVGRAEYSEYMTWYMRNNREIFKVNIVDLPPEMVRPHRLTLDYQEDLELFSRIFDELSEADRTTANIFKLLDRRPDLRQINEHRTLVYETDKQLIDKFNRVTKISV
jgi:N,N'-diacetyllegionaminate synthase